MAKFIGTLPEDKIGAGILYLKSDDLVSRLLLKLTQEDYSCLGFYYRSSLSGTSRYRVILVDLLTQGRPIWLADSTQNCYLEDIINSSSLSQLKYQPLNPVVKKSGKLDAGATEERQILFRQAIAEYTSVSVPIPEHLKALLLKDSTVSMWAPLLKQINVSIFGDSVNLELSRINRPVTDPVEQQQLQQKLQVYFDHLCSVMTSPELNQSNGEYVALNILPDKEVEEQLAYSDKIIDKIYRLGYERSSNNITKTVNKLKDPQLEYYRKKLYKVLTKTQLKSIERLIQKEDLDIHRHLVDLRQQFKMLHHQVTTQIHPSIDFNVWLTDINRLLKYYGLKQLPLLPGEYADTASLLVTSKSDQIPLTLSSGKKVVLTARSCDLTAFNSEELLELLEVLDVLAPDDRYDYIRTCLTQEYTKSFH